MGSIMAAVAVLLIHIERKAVVAMKPNSSLGGGGGGGGGSTTTVKCPLFGGQTCISTIGKNDPNLVLYSERVL